MPRESVDQCSRFVTACGMNDQSRPFVDDDQFVILEKNIQRHFFRRNFAAGRWRKSCDHHIASTQLRAGFGNASIDKHRIFFNQFLERAIFLAKFLAKSPAKFPPKFPPIFALILLKMIRRIF